MQIKIRLLAVVTAALVTSLALGLPFSVHAVRRPDTAWLGIWWLELAGRLVNLSLLAATALLAITVWRRQVSQLRLSLEVLRDLEQTSSDLIWQTDAAGVLTVLSDSSDFGSRVCTLRSGSSIGSLRERDPLTPADKWEKNYEQISAGHPFRDFRYFAPTTAGGLACLSVSGVAIRDARGGILGYRGMTRDKTTEWEAMTALSRQAFQDELTELPNRRALKDALQNVLANTDEQAVVLLIVDLDGFKHINDLHGHLMGDMLLRAVAQHIREAVQPAASQADTRGMLIDTKHSNCLPARIGGDEFAVLLAGEKAKQAEEIALAILASVSAPIELIPQVWGRVGASIGIAQVESGGCDVDRLFGQADAALYDVKNAGGGALRFYSEADPSSGRQSIVAEAEQLDDAPLAAALAQALEAGELHLVYQPIRSCADGQVTSIEVLCRWHSKHYGVVPSSTFIPLAERSGLIVSLGEWVLRHALAEATAVDGCWSLSINLSPIQIETTNIVQTLATAIYTSGIDASRVILEITEGLLLSPTTKTLQKLRRLRLLGVRLALDDFGTGYANIKSLDEIHFDILKFDRSIIQTNPARRENLLRGLMEIARAFDLPTVFEGIETPDQWHLASRLGATSGQGYLLGRPQRDLLRATGISNVIPDIQRIDTAEETVSKMTSNDLNLGNEARHVK
ncbi:putative bifunctional diguanylate cyclase/phosphodiesterase [Sphingomonas sp. RS2018]